MTPGFILFVLLAAFGLAIAKMGLDALKLVVGLGWVIAIITTVGSIAWEFLRRL